jgi:alkylation response protein AidB-like acyl-CoA dehydrogenase
VNQLQQHVRGPCRLASGRRVASPRYRAMAIGAGTPDVCPASVAKVHATAMAQKVTLQCQQMFGGYGYLGVLRLERMVRDVCMLTVTGGTTQTQKNTIANPIFPR